MITSDLSKFGRSELVVASNILLKYSQDCMTDRARENFSHSGVHLEFNMSYDYIFLVDDDHNMLMLNDNGELDIYLNTPDGLEGFFDDLLEWEYRDMSDDDKEYMKLFDTEHQIDDLIIDNQDNDISDDSKVNEEIIRGDDT